jgi:23S rRNA (uracil1939-C5)-methyltransferase
MEGTATVKRKGDSPGKGSIKTSLYRRPATEAVHWQGTVERLAWGGMGVARGEDGRLLLLSAPLALFPGERVAASVRWKSRHGEGRVTAWVDRDPRRVQAGCAVAEVCGGCDLWEAGPRAGDLKREMVADLLGRQLPGAPPWRWLEAPEGARRHRIQLHWTGRELGVYRRNSHAVVPVAACPAAAGCLSRAIPRLGEALAAGILPRREQRWELATGTPPGDVCAADETGRAWRLEPDGWHPGAGPIAHGLGTATLRHRPGGFFQACPDWAWTAFGAILGEWGLEGDTLYDLYGGVGFFSALLGNRFRRRVLVESDEDAVGWARKNLEALGLDSECIAADAAEWVPAGLGGESDLILLDPPRAGLEPGVCERLRTAGAGTLVMVGCDGAAFCRDVRRLGPEWRVEGLAAADLFPLTVHVECLAWMKRVI